MIDFVLNPKLFVHASPPGDTLLETIEAIGMSQAELALRTGRPVKTINEIIKGKAAITPETALQFEKVLGISASFWINRERQYRESLARKDEKNKLEGKTSWLEHIPLKEMVDLGWIEHSDEPLEQLEETLGFFGISSPELWEPVALGKYSNLENSPSYREYPGSVTAWLRKGEIDAQQEHCDAFHPRLLKDSLSTIRKLSFQSVQSFYAQLKEICNQAGVAFCLVPELPGSNIHAITRWITNEKALIQISDHYQHDDTFWFAFFHALGHVLLHGKRDIFIEEDGIKDQKEEEADQFAKEQLIQVQALRTLLSTSKAINRDTLQTYSSDLGISPGVLVGWMQREEIIGKIQFNDLKRSLVWSVVRDQSDEETSWVSTAEEDDLRSSQTATQQPVDLQLNSWPGLSAGARQALLAAGYQDEAGRVDERLFAEWVGQQLANIESALNQGYYRDCLMDLENLMTVVRIGVKRSPALEAMEKTLGFLGNIIRSSTQVQPDQGVYNLARQAIVETNRSTQELMVSEARKQYSAAATKTESKRVNNLLNQW